MLELSRSMSNMRKDLRIFINMLRRTVHRWRRFFVAPSLPDTGDGKRYINVGCGLQSGPEFINVDIVPSPGIHYVHDIRTLDMFPSESADLLYASHIMEHIPRHELDSVITEWRRVLKPGGVLRISVPDFDSLLTIYHASGNDIASILAQLLGQEPPYNNHYSVWNWDYIQRFFLERGFKEVRRWDPHNAPHYSMHDRAERVLTSGEVSVPLSLNVEAIK